MNTHVDVFSEEEISDSMLITSEFDETTSESLTDMQRAILEGDNKGQSYGQFIDEGARQEANIAALCEGQVEGRAILAMTELVRKNIAGILN
jgi:hypothetical protein